MYIKNKVYICNILTIKNYIKMAKFHDKVRNLQVELKAPKNQFNGFGKYKYRNQEDILEAVKPLLDKHKLNLIIKDEVKELVRGDIYVQATAVLFDDEGRIEVTAQAGIDTNKKGMDISQSFGSSSSYARKYALNGLFLIDDTKDADSSNNHGKSLKTLLANTPEFNKAVEYLSKGGSISNIKSKYKITEEVEKLLTTKK